MKKIVGIICAVTLLILISLVGMVLAFCLAEDPALFKAVTASAAQSVGDAAGALGNGAVNAVQAVGDGAVSAAGRVRAFFDRSTVLEPIPGVQAHPLSLRVLPPPEEEEEETPPEPAEQLVTAGTGGATALVLRDGAEVLTGGTEIIYYNQKDEAWAEQSYGGDPIGRYGCGPTVMAMAVSSLTETSMDPAEMAAWCADKHYNASKSGSRATLVPGTAEGFGLTCTPLSIADPDALLDALRDGGLAAALMGPGHFTTGGHYILLHGVTEDGLVLAADPNSRENSLTPWDVHVILDELSSQRAEGAPLWLLTLPEEPSAELPES